MRKLRPSLPRMQIEIVSANAAYDIPIICTTSLACQRCICTSLACALYNAIMILIMLFTRYQL